MSEKEIFDKLRESLLNYDEAAVVEAAKQAIDEDLNIIKTLEILSSAIREVGDKFEAGEAFLPELIMAADVMKAGTAVLTPAIPKDAEVSTPGTVVLGTVKGDIHDIGKTIVGTMLTAARFNVVDVGIDVAPSEFLDAAEKSGADIIGAAAIMATTLPGQSDLIEYLKALGIRGKYKVMVGGAACTREYANKIGADGYGEDAVEAVKVAEELLRKRATLR